MISTSAAPFVAFFLPVDGAVTNRRFCLFHPAQGQAALGAILYIHPFAEEMNKSRRMAAMQARAMARAGYSVLQFDLLGCGDSDGDFGEATWQDWVDDVLRGCAWLTERVAAPLWLWGLRVGCLLAVEAEGRLTVPAHLLFWAPVASGKLALQQFLRLKAAGDLASGKAKNVMASLRSTLAQGHPVEIAGYTLATELANGLDQASLSPSAPKTRSERSCRLEWLDLTTREASTLSPATANALHAWNANSSFVARGHMVPGPAFWQTTEIEDAPNLIEATMLALREDNTP